MSREFLAAGIYSCTCAEAACTQYMHQFFFEIISLLCSRLFKHRLKHFQGAICHNLPENQKVRLVHERDTFEVTDILLTLKTLCYTV